MLRSRTLRMLVIGGLVAALTLGATAAFAQETDTTETSQPTETLESPVVDGPEHLRPRAAWRIAGKAIATVEDLTGLDHSEILEGLGDGATLAELAEDEGVSTAELVDALVAEVTEWVDEAVTDGKLTQDQADRILEAAPERIERLVTTTHPGHKIAKRFHHRAVRVLDTVTEILEVNRGEVISTLRSGGTLAELAEEQGMTPEELVDALVAEVTERADQAVTDGKLTQDQADRILDAAPERIERLVTEPFPGPGPRPGPHGSGPDLET